MAKKLISVWLSLTILLFSSISIYAGDNVQGDFFNKKVVINGSEVKNYNLQYPFFLYKGSTYIPLSLELGGICGFEAEMDWESRTLKLLKTETTQKQLKENWTKNNGEDIGISILDDVKVVAYEEVVATESAVEAAEEVELASEVIDTPEILMEELNLGSVPVLLKDKTLFIPVRAFANSEIFKWTLHYDGYYGVCISTEEAIPAKNYWNEAESRYNLGLTNYMVKYNYRVPQATAQDYVFMFKRAGEVYGVDEKLLIAIAHKESTFTASIVSRSGAVGLMQIMPATGAIYGATVTDLQDPRKNINVGAAIISTSLNNYGDLVKGLSAYNQGSSRVNRGTYSTAYATRVLTAYNGLNNYLSSNGYN